MEKNSAFISEKEGNTRVFTGGMFFLALCDGINFHETMIKEERDFFYCGWGSGGTCGFAIKN